MTSAQIGSIKGSRKKRLFLVTLYLSVLCLSLSVCLSVCLSICLSLSDYLSLPVSLHFTLSLFFSPFLLSSRILVSVTFMSGLQATLTLPLHCSALKYGGAVYNLWTFFCAYIHISLFLSHSFFSFFLS